MEKIKFSKNNINKKDIREVEKILKSGWLTHGKYSNHFEKEFSKFTKSKSSIITNEHPNVRLILYVLKILFVRLHKQEEGMIITRRSPYFLEGESLIALL